MAVYFVARGSKQATEKKRRRKPKDLKTGEEAGPGDQDEEKMDADDDEGYEDEDDDDDDVEVAEDDLENLALDADRAKNEETKSCENQSQNQSEIKATTVGASVGSASTGQDSMETTPSEISEPTPSTSSATQQQEDIFQVTIGPQSGASSDGATKSSGVRSPDDLFVPCGRMKPCLAVKNGVLYLYGGTYEEGDRQVTLSDFYSLDLAKLDQWKIIIAPVDDKQVWWTCCLCTLRTLSRKATDFGIHVGRTVFIQYAARTIKFTKPFVCVCVFFFFGLFVVCVLLVFFLLSGTFINENA
jgi:hypothetical protein